MLKEIEKMCRDLSFDRSIATNIIKQVDINQEFISSRFKDTPYQTTLLNEAIMSNNIQMVELLLQNSADPNLIFDNRTECVLWGLQYPGDDAPEDDDIRLRMTQLLLEAGADPCITPEDSWEDLFSWVASATFNDDFDDLWEYRTRFFVLLVAYGGKSDYCTPRIVGEFDKSNIQQYQFFLVPEGNNKYSGVIIDSKGNNIAYI